MMLEYFFPIPNLSPGELRRLVETTHPEDFTLLDVRQPMEYQAGHIAGAVLIPVAQLEARLDELDPKRKTIVYCAAGVRSRAAASLLLHHGFQEVFNLSGGFHSWQGLTASGMPEELLETFSGITGAEQHVALAWYLEEGARRFYTEVAELLGKGRLGRLFQELAEAEVGHKRTLLAVYEGLTKRKPPEDFPAGLLDQPIDTAMMEGGYRVDQAVDLAVRAGEEGVCQLAMAVETNAYDHYLYLQRNAPEENSARVFEVLAGEERRHLARLAQALDELL